MSERISAFLNGAAGAAALLAIEPDSVVEEKPQSPVSYGLGDIIEQTTDDNAITGDNALDHVEVRRPGKQEWFRVHPTWQLSTRVVIVQQGTKDTVHLIHKSVPITESLEQDSVPALIRVCINFKGRIFIWVIKKSKEDGGLSKIYARALEHLEIARTDWIRRFWVDDLHVHVARVAKDLGEPAWPTNATFQDVIVAGFGSRIITTLDAPVLLGLRGGVADA